MDNKLAIFSILIVCALFVSACSANTQKTGAESSGNTVETSNTGSTSAADSKAGGTTSTDNSGAVKIVTVEMYNFGFKWDGPVIHKGDKVKLIVKDTDGTHGIAIPDLGVDVSPVNPGEEKSVEFTADQSGSFTYFCNVPCGSGHRNMRGTFVVE